MVEVVALVRGLFEGWLPRSATWVGAVAGPLVMAGYLAGSLPFGYLWSRRRLRRQLDRPGPAPPGLGRDRRAGRVVAAGLAVGGTLLATTLAWDVARAATPTRGTFSAVAVFSNQAIQAWVSVALWTGTAVVVGQVAPVWTGFRGGSRGLAAAGALVGAYAPTVLAAALASALVALGLARTARTAMVAALAGGVAFEYLAWMADLQGGWGVTNGPELALWSMVLAGVLAVRNLR